MRTIELYTTPQCGFCIQLKATLDEKGIEYTAYDVTTDSTKLEEMKELSGGSLSVPVAVINKGKDDQVVTVGYPDAIAALKLGEKSSEKEATKPGERGSNATLTCPKCGHQQSGEIPTTACVPYYVCEGCGETIKAEGEDCCVFCSYADEPCPLKSGEHGCEGGVCSIS